MQSYDCLIITHSWSRQCAEAPLCFVQGHAAEQHGCGVVWWFVTSEAALTTRACVLHVQIISLKLKDADAKCDTALMWDCKGFFFVHYNNGSQALPRLTISAHLNCCLHLKNWWQVKPVEINDFQEISTASWHVGSVIEEACKNTFVWWTAVCVSVCVCVCVSIPLCEWKKPALKAILLLWSLWWNSWRGKAGGLFCESGRSVLEAASCPVKHPGSFLHQTAGQRIWSPPARQLYLAQTASSKQQHDCVLSYLLVWRAYGISSFSFFWCARVCVCVCVCGKVLVSVRMSSR